MNYLKLYHDICNRGHERGTKRCKGYELHHILPVSYFKNRKIASYKENLCILTPKEHYVVHHLLSRTGCGKMYRAFWMFMKGCKHRTLKYTAKEYELVKLNQPPVSDETKLKLSIAGKGKQAGELNPMFGKCGDQNPFYGKTHSDEMKKYLSEKVAWKVTVEYNGEIFQTKNSFRRRYNFSKYEVSKMIALGTVKILDGLVKENKEINNFISNGVRNEITKKYNLTNSISRPKSSDHKLKLSSISKSQIKRYKDVNNETTTTSI